jgi:hypothetical protein
LLPSRPFEAAIHGKHTRKHFFITEIHRNYSNIILYSAQIKFAAKEVFNLKFTQSARDKASPSIMSDDDFQERKKKIASNRGRGGGSRGKRGPTKAPAVTRFLLYH